MSKKPRPPPLKAEGFSLKANLKTAVVVGPPKTAVFEERTAKPSMFCDLCSAGKIPIALTHSSRGNGIKWKVDIETLDYHFYLPMFFEGLTETSHPYEKYAVSGIHDMLDHAGAKILPVIPQLIPLIRNAMDTRNAQIVCNTLKILQHLVMSADGVGEALVPYFKRILPIFNIFMTKFSRQASSAGTENVRHLLDKTLQILHRNGGKDAYKIIKSVIPTFDNCV